MARATFLDHKRFVRGANQFLQMMRCDCIRGFGISRKRTAGKDLNELAIVVYVNNQSGGALSAIAASGYRHVPVLDMDGQVVGIVSPRRVFAFLERYLNTV